MMVGGQARNQADEKNPPIVTDETSARRDDD
jgi:hypothetical protein